MNHDVLLLVLHILKRGLEFNNMVATEYKVIMKDYGHC